MKAGITIWTALLLCAAMLPSHADARQAAPDAKHSSVTMTTPALPAHLLKSVLDACAKRRLLIVGELHGTNETEETTVELVKLAMDGRPVMLGLEIPVTEQTAIDAYLASAGGAADKALLLRGPFWGFPDGRASNAMLGLIDSVRLWRAAERDVDIFTMEPEYPSEAAVTAAGGITSFKEAGMAGAIQKVLDKNSAKVLVIALMGNYHSRYEPGVVGKGASVTERLLSVSPYVLLPVARQTSAWVCMQDGCSVHSHTSTQAPASGLPKLVADTRIPDGLAITKLWLPIMTASPPLKPAPAAASAGH